MTLDELRTRLDADAKANAEPIAPAKHVNSKIARAISAIARADNGGARLAPSSIDMPVLP